MSSIAAEESWDEMVAIQETPRRLWAVGMRDLALSAGSFPLAASHKEAWKQRERGRVLTLARFIVAVAITFFGVEQVLHPEFAPGVPLAKLTPLWIPVHVLWGFATGAIFVVGGVCLLIKKQARLAATWLGLMTLLLVVFVDVPIVAADPSDIGNAFNHLVDTLLLSGTLLALAGALSVCVRTRKFSPAGTNECSPGR